MPKNTSFSLSEHHVDFIHDQVQSGQYGSASEVIREGLRLLEHRQLKVAQLRQAIQEGLDSGPAEPFDPEAFLGELKRDAATRG